MYLLFLFMLFAPSLFFAMLALSGLVLFLKFLPVLLVLLLIWFIIRWLCRRSASAHS